MSARVLVITGPPGAGKTTVARLVAAELPRSGNLHADDFFHYVQSGYEPPWKPEAHSQNGTVIRAIAAAATAFAEGGYEVVVDGIVGPWFLEELIRPLPRSVPVHYVVLRPSAEAAARRAASRQAEGALTEPGPIQHMYRQFADLGPYDTNVVDSSGMTAEQTAQAVLITMGRTRLGR